MSVDRKIQRHSRTNAVLPAELQMTGVKVMVTEIWRRKNGRKEKSGGYGIGYRVRSKSRVMKGSCYSTSHDRGHLTL